MKRRRSLYEGELKEAAERIAKAAGLPSVTVMSHAHNLIVVKLAKTPREALEQVALALEVPQPFKEGQLYLVIENEKFEPGDS